MAELLEAIRYNDPLDEITALITNGADVNYRDAYGKTPLHVSCANGTPGVTALLLAHGAVSTANDQGNTPLHWAALNGNLPEVRLLLESETAGAQADAKNADGHSAVWLATRGDHEEVAMLLMEKADIPDDVIEGVKDGVDPETAEAIAEAANRMAEEEGEGKE